MTDFVGAYELAHEKPDKKYSMLPTMIHLCSPLQNNEVIELGCGTGFFTKPLAISAKHVLAIDHCTKALADAPIIPNVTYREANIFDYTYPNCDIVCAPYVLNYASSLKELEQLISKLSASLNREGKIVSIVDLPKNLLHDNRRFGSVKKIKSFEDEQKIDIRLFNDDKEIFSFESTYFAPQTLERVCLQNGLSPEWHLPFVSKKGIERFGSSFWQDYIHNCEVGYFVAKKF